MTSKRAGLSMTPDNKNNNKYKRKFWTIIIRI